MYIPTYWLAIGQVGKASTIMHSKIHRNNSVHLVIIQVAFKAMIVMIVIDLGQSAQSNKEYYW